MTKKTTYSITDWLRCLFSLSGVACLVLVGCNTYENSRVAEERALARAGTEDDVSDIYEPSKKPYVLTQSSLLSLSTPAGKPQSISIGEVMYKGFKGKWQQSYVLQQDFSFGKPIRTRDGQLKGSIAVSRGSTWADRFRDKDGTIFLTSSSAGRHAYAIKINPDGSLKKPYRAYQIGRGNTVRQFYPLYNVPEGTVFKKGKEVPLPGARVSGWGIRYSGQRSGSLQFKLFDINTRGDEIRPVMFEHDLSKSKEVIVRGVTFTISELKDNGVLTYSVVE